MKGSQAALHDKLKAFECRRPSREPIAPTTGTDGMDTPLTAQPEQPGLAWDQAGNAWLLATFFLWSFSFP